MTIHEFLAKHFFEVNLEKKIFLFFFFPYIHLIPSQIVINDSKLKCDVTYSLFI